MFKTIKIFFILFILYLLAGFFLLPKLLLPKLQEIANKELNASVSIDKLSINPLTFTLRVSGIQVKQKKQNHKILELAYAEIDANPTELLYGTVGIGEIYLQKPKLYIKKSKDNQLNLLSIIKSKKEDNTTAAQSEDSLVHIVLNHFNINDATCFFDDYSKKEPFHIELHNFFLDIENVDTHNLQEGSLHLHTKVAQSGHIELHTKIKKVKPLVLDGSFGFEIDDLSKEFAYVAEKVKFHLTQGRASFFTRYSVDTNNTTATKLSHLNFSLYDLKTVANRDNKELLDIDYLYINDMDIKPLQHQAHIPHAGVKKVVLNIERKSKNRLDWQEYLNLEENSQKSSEENISELKTQEKWDVALADFILSDINIQFNDYYITPHVTTTLDTLSLHAKDITLSGEQALSYDLAFMLNKEAKCKSSGSLLHKELDLESTIVCSEFEVAHYTPYIEDAAQKVFQKYDLNLKSAKLDANVNLKLTQESNNSIVVQLQKSELGIKSLRLKQKSSAKELVAFNDLRLRGIVLNTKTKEGSIENIVLKDLALSLIRYSDGHLNTENLLIAKKRGQKEQKKPKQETFHFLVKEVHLDNGALDFYDKSISPAAKKSVKNIDIKVQKIDTNANTWLNYKASMRVGKRAYASLYGKVRHTPLKQIGGFSLKRFSLQEINPYLQQNSYVKITKGELSLSANESYMQRKKGADLRLKGRLLLNDFIAVDTNDADMKLLAIEKLKIKPLTLELHPNRLYIDEVGVNGFYVAAKIDENRSINFARLLKKSNTDQKREVKNKKDTDENNFDIKIAKLDINGSQAYFEDLSLPIKFKTDIHTLNGVVYAISNKPGETTFINIDGEVDKYGSTKIKGSLDSFNPKKFTDINLEFKNLDLSAMSGYSASFAGYTIASGKLFLDLGYKIKDAKLHATNKVVIKQIKLGKEIQGDNINHLPLGFVLGLLEDSNGVINIELPIEGNLDEPDFKYGKIVWNAFTNLITTAVSSPFRLLGSMLGIDTNKLSALHFEYGKAVIAPPEKEKLDTIAQIMQKRPKILLKVTPVYDEVADKEALQMQKLIALVMQKSGVENIEKSKNALTVDMLEDICAQMDKEEELTLLREQIEKKYSDKKAYERAYQNALIALCRDMQSVKKEELVSLAKARANRVKDYLMKKDIVFTRIVENDVNSVHNEAKSGVEMPLEIDITSSDK